MRIVTGILSPDDTTEVVQRLVDSGFSYDDLSLMTSAAEMPEFLEGDAEESAVSGAALGAITGGAFGALGTFVASTLPGFQSMVVSGLMATSMSGVIGAYLGSLYSVRAEKQTEIDVHEALEQGDVLVVIRTTPENEDLAIEYLEEVDGRDVAAHEISEEEAEDELP